MGFHSKTDLSSQPFPGMKLFGGGVWKGLESLLYCSAAGVVEMGWMGSDYSGGNGWIVCCHDEFHVWWAFGIPSGRTSNITQSWRTGETTCFFKGLRCYLHTSHSSTATSDIPESPPLSCGWNVHTWGHGVNGNKKLKSDTLFILVLLESRCFGRFSTEGHSWSYLSLNLWPLYCFVFFAKIDIDLDTFYSCSKNITNCSMVLNLNRLFVVGCHRDALEKICSMYKLF